MSIGKYAYFVPSIIGAPIRGKIISVEKTRNHWNIITIRAKNGKEFSGPENLFSLRYPAICKYWR